MAACPAAIVACALVLAVSHVAVLDGALLRIAPGALLRPGPPRNRTGTFQRIRLEQAVEVRRRGVVRSARNAGAFLSAGPFTAACAAASNLSVGAGVVVIFFSLAPHLTASARFRAGPQGSVFGPRYAGRLPGGGNHRCPGFPLRFRRRHSLLGHPMPAEELGSSSRSAYRPEGRTSTGLPLSARTTLRPGWVPPYTPEDGGAHPGRGTCSAGACRSATASPSTALIRPSVLQGSLLRGISRRFRFFTRPACPSPVAPGWVGRPWASPASFAPHRYRRRTSRAGPGHRSTDLELRDHIKLILQSGSSLVAC